MQLMSFRKKIEKGKIKLIASYLLVIYILHIVFNTYIREKYAYMTFYTDFSASKFSESLIIVILTTLFLPSIIKKSSDLFLHVFYVLTFLPMLVIYSSTNRPRIFTYIIIACYFMLLIIRRIKIKKIKTLKIETKAIVITLLSFSYLFIFLLAWEKSFKLNFDFSFIYEFRKDFSDNLHPLVGYLSPLVTKLFLPSSLLLSIDKKMFFLGGLSIIGSVVLFGLTNHKVVLAYPIIISFLYYILMSKYSTLTLFVRGSLFLLFISLIMHLLFGNDLLNIFITRRSFLVPAYLNYVYLDYFSSHDFALWSNSKITLGMVDTVYNGEVIAKVIGLEFYGNENTNANTGWIGSGYMQAGYIGMFVYATVLGLVLSYIDKCSGYNNERSIAIISAISSPSIIAIFISSDLVSALLTQGLLATLILISALGKKNE